MPMIRCSSFTPAAAPASPRAFYIPRPVILLYAYQTMKWIFDIKDEDIYWCTADIGWITGHTYIVYGPLSVGATSLMYESVPTYPKAGQILADRRKIQSQYFLYRSHRHPLIDEREHGLR